MTAIVGIMNRQGISFAADSAATLTLSTTHKISNHANKIFELSRCNPIGIALYGNMDFMRLPWEEIIKIYRKKLSGSYFDFLKNYADNFFEFLRTDIITVMPQISEENRICAFVDAFYDEIYQLAKKEVQSQGLPLIDENITKEICRQTSSLCAAFKNHEVADDFKDYELDAFKLASKKYVEEKLLHELSKVNDNGNLQNDFSETLFYIIRSKSHTYCNHSGLIIFGYGEKDLFPSYFHYKISYLFKNKIKLELVDKYEVSPDNDACIAPFAQTDVTNTVVRGIDDSLRSVFYEKNHDILQTFKNLIIDKLKGINAVPKIIEGIEGIDINIISESFKKEMDAYIWNSYIKKLVQTVAFLSKEDLGDMAESLVKMTGLKRKVTTDEESVGGPVDVAVVTKGDGFVWLKRKHYFAPDINNNYFQRSKLV